MQVAIFPVLMVGAIYLLLWRPQQRRIAAVRRLQSQIQEGDEVLTVLPGTLAPVFPPKFTMPPVLAFTVAVVAMPPLRFNMPVPPAERFALALLPPTSTVSVPPVTVVLPV